MLFLLGIIFNVAAMACGVFSMRLTNAYFEADTFLANCHKPLLVLVLAACLWAVGVTLLIVSFVG